MAEYRESSMLFSLKGLMDVEERRIHEQRATQEKKLEAARAARLESERAASQAQARLAEAARQRAFQEELGRRQYAARLEALRQAELERARIEAESRAQLEIFERKRAHEERLREIEHRSRSRRSRTLAVVAWTMSAATLILGSGLYFGKFRPDAQRLEQACESLAATQRSRAETAQQLLDRAHAREADLERELAQARRDRDHARREFDQLRRARTPGRSASKRAPPIRAAGTPHCGDASDPLNGCLPLH